MNELVRVAMLGTRQHAGALPESGTGVDALIAKLSLDRERALLLIAGGADFLRRAGKIPRPLPADAPLAEAPQETLSRASASLGALLSTVFGSESTELLREALELMAAAGLRLPEELLPLALSERDPAVRQALGPVLGERGRFLAAGNGREDWLWARPRAQAAPSLPHEADRLWEEGDALEREWLFAVARGVAPDKARAWLAATFKSERPEQRKKWLELLERRLSADDLPLLESALNDRSSLVRTSAARISWRLPTSATARSVLALARECFQAEPFEARLPAESQGEALEKLGILPTPPSGVGARQFWLAQLLSACPPDQLCAPSSRSPTDILAAMQRHELGDALLEGFTSATLRFDAKRWLAPLWDLWSHREAQTSWLERLPLAQLSRGLPLTELEPRLIACLREQRQLGLLELMPRPWPAALSRAFLQLSRARPFWLAPVLPVAARRLPLSLVAAEGTLPSAHGEEPRYLAAAFDEFSMILDFRRQLAQEMKQ